MQGLGFGKSEPQYLLMILSLLILPPYHGGNCIQAVHPWHAAVQAKFLDSYCGSDPFINLVYVRALRPLRFLAHTRVDAYPRHDFFCGEDSDRRTLLPVVLHSAAVAIAVTANFFWGALGG
nr:hypothetical protein [Pseudomonas syringae pv. coryli]